MGYGVDFPLYQVGEAKILWVMGVMGYEVYGLRGVHLYPLPHSVSVSLLFRDPDACYVRMHVFHIYFILFVSCRASRCLGSAESATARFGNRDSGSAGSQEDHGASRAYQKIPQSIHSHTTTTTTTTTMKAPSTALLRTFSPLWRSEAPLATARGCLAQQQQQHADFSSTPANQARDKRNKKDPRISMPTLMELLQLRLETKMPG